MNRSTAQKPKIESHKLSTKVGQLHRLPNTSFWKKCFERVSSGRAADFIQAVVYTQNVDFYDVSRVLADCPDDWKKKASVVRAWPGILESVGRQFAPNLTNEYTFDRFLEDVDADSTEATLIRESVLEGLSESSDLTDASALFGVSRVLAHFVSPGEANAVTDFALSRFEEHMESDFADGSWESWLAPPEDMTATLAGFVWAALGSPRTDTRWRAAHCVRRLAGLKCNAEIDALIDWMTRDEVGAFETNKFPFYNLHARLYLLIALSRVANDNPEMLRRHHNIFADHALGGLPHILIQTFAARTALSIEQAYPSTYDSETARQLSEVGVSKMPARKRPETGVRSLETPWHARGEVDQSLDLFFAHDFDRYWFDSLARVFGTSANQLEELAREIVLNEWEVEVDDRLMSDPRDHLWRTSHPYRETWHSHASYPKTDDRRFYISYHALMSVAARLLQEMPVVHKGYLGENPLQEWTQRHDLTRSDGKWLSDRRDTPPCERRDWILEGKTDGWLEEVDADDFLDGLLTSRSGEAWLNVYGNWSDHDGQRIEEYHAASALVTPEGAQSLLNALSACTDPYEYKLPEYREERGEFDSSPFELVGWVHRGQITEEIDDLDPHAGDISYPPYLIGERFASMFGLSPDAEQRKWVEKRDEDPVVTSELWGKHTRTERQKPVRKGSRISASVDFLKRVCSSLNKKLIIEVWISRYSPERNYAGNSNDRKERESWERLYLLSADGTLRDTRTRYGIG